MMKPKSLIQHKVVTKFKYKDITIIKH